MCKHMELDKHITLKSRATENQRCFETIATLAFFQNEIKSIQFK